MRVRKRRTQILLNPDQAAERIAALAGGMKAARDLITDWIFAGKVQVSARYIGKYPETYETMSVEIPRMELEQLGLIRPLLSHGVHRTRHLMEVTERFWELSLDEAQDALRWDWEAGDFVAGYHASPGEAESYWLASGIKINAAHLDILAQLLPAKEMRDANSTVSEPSVQPDGSHRDPRRAQWTKRAVTMLLAKHIPLDMTPNALILTIERSLITDGTWGGSEHKFDKPLDRTTIYDCAQAVLEALKEASIRGS